jgi:O-antigen/teichoic acid export membrane protein
MHKSIISFCLLGMFVAEFASACAVCFGGEPETRHAFYTTAIALTILPLLMIGSGVYALNRRMRKFALEDADD